MDRGKRTIVNLTNVNLATVNKTFCHQVRDSHMAAAAKPPDFAPQVDEEDIEVSDTCIEIFCLFRIFELGDDW